MLSTRLHKFLTAPTDKTSRSRVLFWFSLSLTFAAIYGFLAMHRAFSSPYVVQDDARQHVFWMQRFVDPQLFPNDIIADYMQSIAPDGYAAFYHLMAIAGLDPLVFNKLLPILLSAIATSYCFSVSMQLLPVPATGFIATLLLNQCLWLKDDLISATPRAFFYPLFVAFLYYFLRRSLLFETLAIALMGMFYPPGLLLCAGLVTLQLVRWEFKEPNPPTPFPLAKPALSAQREGGEFVPFEEPNPPAPFPKREGGEFFPPKSFGEGVRGRGSLAHIILYPKAIFSLTVALAMLLYYALAPAEFGSVISAAAAKSMPEFLPGGRVSFFLENPWSFWLDADRSGLLPWPLSSLPPLLVAGLLLPVLLRFSSCFPLAKQVSANVRILGAIALLSIGLFLSAHAVLFKLYLPSRYTAHSLRVVLAIAAAIALTLLLDAIFSRSWWPHSRLLLPVAFLILFGLIFYPNFLQNFPKTNYKIGSVPVLYEFLKAQPKDSLIASISSEANNLPSFSQRSILVGKEYALPYHPRYYREIRQRTIDLIRAQYSSDLADAKQLIQKYGVDFWLLDRAAFTPKYLDNDWLKQYQPTTAEALAKLERGNLPALANVMNSCKVLETEALVLLQASCIAKDEG